MHPTDGAIGCTDACGDGCEDCGGGYVKERRGLPHTYGTVEYMMAWTSGSSRPPLVTTLPRHLAF